MAKNDKHGEIGHNSGLTEGQLTEDQNRALFFHHLKKIKGLKDDAATATSNLRNAYKVAKSEGYTKKDIDFALSLEKDEGDMSDRRRREAEIARWMNHPIGTQADLFDDDGNIPDRRSVEEKAFEAGKKVGSEGDPCQPPADYSGDVAEKWVEGWHKGQEALFSINEMREKPEAELIPSEDNAPDEADEFDEAADGEAGEEKWPDDQDIEATEKTEEPA